MQETIYYLALRDIEGPGVKLLDGPFLSPEATNARRDMYPADDVILVKVEVL